MTENAANMNASQVPSISPVLSMVDEVLKDKITKVEQWMDRERTCRVPPFYSSVDVRHAGFKLAPVDTNLFPAGFNTLSEVSRGKAAVAIRRYLDTHFTDQQIQKILLLPETHTRNLAYLDNVAILKNILEAAELTVTIGSLDPEVMEALELESASGHSLIVEPIHAVQENKRSYVETRSGYRPDMLIVNNDMSNGAPEILSKIAQPVIPPVGMGWYQRRKWVHFAAYQELAASFASAIDIDPWLISAQFHRCGLINFKEKTGIECVALGVEKVLHGIRTKYEEYGIDREPYVFIKADSGTYGMGIMTVRSGEEVMEMNKKLRKQMNVIKGGVSNSEVIIQEGVPTIDRVDNQPAEPMIYLVEGMPIGGAYRVNEQRDSEGNLNAPGMRFSAMCSGEGPIHHVENRNDCGSPEFRAFGLIAQLASMAASREIYDSYEI